MRGLFFALILTAAAGAYDLADFAALSREWQTCRHLGYTPAWDLDRSGCVDQDDLCLFLDRWLMGQFYLEAKYLQLSGVSVPYHSNFSFGDTNITLTFWAKDSFSYIYQQGANMISSNGENNVNVFLVDTQSNVFNWAIDISNFVGWNFYVFQINRNINKAFFFKNGVLINQTTFTLGNVDTGGNFLLGYKTHLDDLRLYRSVLTQEQLSAIYKNGIGTFYSASPLEGGKADVVFEFNEGSGQYTYSTVITDETSLSGILFEGSAFSLGGVPFTQKLTAYCEKNINAVSAFLAGKAMGWLP